MLESALGWLQEIGGAVRADLRRAAWAAVALFVVLVLGGLGIVLASAAVMLAAWESYRVAAAASLAVLYLAVAAFALWKVRTLAAATSNRSADPIEGALAVARWVAGGVVLYSVVRKLNRMLS